MGKAVKKAERALPLSLRKRTTVIKKLAMNTSISLQGPLAKTKKITTNISDHIIEIVKNFYAKDDILQQAPGKRDTVVMKENYERKTFQKCYFRNKYVLYSSDSPQNVCTCIYHENVMLILYIALHRIDSIYPLYSHNLPNKFVCSQSNDDCWFNKCNQCKDALVFSKNYHLQNDATLQEVRWYQWENAVNSAGKKRLEKVLKETLIDDLHDSLCTQLPAFITHYYIKQKPGEAYQQNLKEAKETDSVGVLQVDFSENFSTFWQDEVQSAHWNKKKITIFLHVFGIKIYVNLQL